MLRCGDNKQVIARCCYWRQRSSDIPRIASYSVVDSSWNVMAHGDARDRKWRGNWRMEWVASTLHTNSEHGVSNITTAGAHNSAASSRLNWRPRRFKWTRPFRRKTKSGFCTCAITFQLASTEARRPALEVSPNRWAVSSNRSYKQYDQLTLYSLLLGLRQYGRFCGSSGLNITVHYSLLLTDTRLLYCVFCQWTETRVSFIVSVSYRA